MISQNRIVSAVLHRFTLCIPGGTEGSQSSKGRQLDHYLDLRIFNSFSSIGTISICLLVYLNLIDLLKSWWEDFIVYAFFVGFMWPTNYGQLSVKFVPNPGISSKNRTRGVERQLSRRLIELIRESDVVRSSTPLAAVILSVLWMLLGTVRHLSFLFPHCCPWIIARGGL